MYITYIYVCKREILQSILYGLILKFETIYTCAVSFNEQLFMFIFSTFSRQKYGCGCSCR